MCANNLRRVTPPAPSTLYAPLDGDRHRHGRLEHTHPHTGPHNHGDREHAHRRDHGRGHHRDHDHAGGAHGHSHGLIDSSIKRSRAGLRAVTWSLVVLGATALAQTLIFVSMKEGPLSRVGWTRSR